LRGRSFQNAGETAIAALGKLLGKFYFLKLDENLRRILFDYEEKRLRTTNAAFKGAC
jgi:hypothetical protein